MDRVNLEEKIKRKLGNETYGKILNFFEAALDGTTLVEIAGKISGILQAKVQRQINEPKGASWRTILRDFFREWESMFPSTEDEETELSVRRLVEILDDPDLALRSLARDIAEAGKVQQQEPTESRKENNGGREETMSKHTTSKNTKYDEPILKLTEEERADFLDTVSKEVANAGPGIDQELATKLGAGDAYKEQRLLDAAKEYPRRLTIRNMLQTGWIMRKGNLATIQSMIVVLKKMELDAVIEKIKETVKE